MAKLQLFFYQKLQLLAKEVVTFFNLSKFVSKEAFLGKVPTSRNNLQPLAFLSTIFHQKLLLLAKEVDENFHFTV